MYGSEMTPFSAEGMRAYEQQQLTNYAAVDQAAANEADTSLPTLADLLGQLLGFDPYNPPMDVQQPDLTPGPSPGLDPFMYMTPTMMEKAAMLPPEMQDYIYRHAQYDPALGAHLVNTVISGHADLFVNNRPDQQMNMRGDEMAQHLQDLAGMNPWQRYWYNHTASDNSLAYQLMAPNGPTHNVPIPTRTIAPSPKQKLGSGAGTRAWEAIQAAVNSWNPPKDAPTAERMHMYTNVYDQSSRRQSEMPSYYRNRGSMRAAYG